MEEKRFFILAPLTEEANEKMYQYDIYGKQGIDDCFLYMEMTWAEEETLEHTLFNLINAKLNLIINIYEEEIIENKDLSDVIELTGRMISISGDEEFIRLATEFENLVKTAMRLGTDVGFYF